MNSESANNSLLSETQYLAPVSAFVRMKSFSTIVIDGDENFQKSTWRNRCTIVNANGKLLLTIPVIGGRGVKSKSKDVRIANDQPWQHIHWRSMLAAYGKSSFFIFYEEKFRVLYEKQFDFLVDFNTELLQLCFKILHWKKTILVNHSNENPERNLQPSTFNPEKSGQALQLYRQVFDSRHGFIADVSIVDLIFNLGNEADEYLAQQSGTGNAEAK